MLFQHQIRHIHAIHAACGDSIGTTADERRVHFHRIVAAYYPHLTRADKARAWSLVRRREQERTRRRRSRDMQDDYAARLTRVFARLDVDGNGRVDAAELKHGLGSTPRESAFVETVFQFAKSTQEGVDVREFLEFASHHPELYAQLDHMTRRLERQATLVENAALPAAAFRTSLGTLRTRRPSLSDCLVGDA